MRRALAIGLALLGFVSPTAAAAKGRPRPARSRAAQVTLTNQRRALDAYAAMQRAYYLPSAGLYRGSPYSAAWPYSQAMAATVSVAGLPGMHNRYRGDLVTRLSNLAAYADHVHPAPAGYESAVAPPRGPGGARYNDDNDWIAIELLRLYHVDRLPTLLDAAGQLLKMVVLQWGTDNDTSCPGGVPWQTANPGSERNIATNATLAELGAQVYMTTRIPDALRAARRAYDWVRHCLQAPSGLYYDHISDGLIDQTIWTYNQGTMIGAGAMLYQATHDPSFLRAARATARAAMARFNLPNLAVQPAAFNAIYMRNLLLLSAAVHDARIQRYVQSFADDAWDNVRDPASGLFLAGPEGSTELLDQAAMVQVYALLGEPSSAYF